MDRPDASTPERRPEAPDEKSAGASRWTQRAYNLVVLTVAVTLLNVWIASVLPLWSGQIQRDKEAELIFRGLQYAEAIRLFQLRNNRLPTKLEELIEVEPRSIRQLYENPMREDGRWGLIPMGVNVGGPGQPVQQAGAPNAQGQNLNQGGNGLDEDPFAAEGDDEDGAKPGVILSADPDDTFAPPSTVPIRGVYHPEGKDSIRTFMNKSNLREWQFTADIYATMKQGSPANPALVTPFLAAEIGRPWPPGVVPQIPQPSAQPQQQQRAQGGNLAGQAPDGSGHMQPRGANQQGQQGAGQQGAGQPGATGGGAAAGGATGAPRP
ncbi:MAG: type II secretion system protein, partial [Acidobacteriota bacterium]